jgi:hypothetical protein
LSLFDLSGFSAMFGWYQPGQRRASGPQTRHARLYAGHPRL